jgi:hypothetical protein
METSGTVNKIKFNKVKMPFALLSSNVNADHPIKTMMNV